MNPAASPVIISSITSSVKSAEFFFSGMMPVPPSVNLAYRLIRCKDGMRVGPTLALEQFKEDAPLMLSQAFHDWDVIHVIRDAKRKVPLHVVLRVYFVTEWKRDLDGVIKYAIDAAFQRIELNDNLVVKLEAEKHVDPIQPRVEIEIYRMSLI